MTRFKLDDLPEHHRADAKAQLRRVKHNQLPQPPSKWEEMFALHCVTLEHPPVREFIFSPIRRWRFDFAWPAVKFAVEIEGLTHDGGRHQRLDGFENDLEKYQQAMLAGWTVYRVSQRLVKTGVAIQTTEKMLAELYAAQSRGNYDPDGWGESDL